MFIWIKAINTILNIYNIKYCYLLSLSSFPFRIYLVRMEKILPQSQAKGQKVKELSDR